MTIMTTHKLMDGLLGFNSNLSKTNSGYIMPGII